ncbi:MAG: glutathione peroxidase [Ignavibacteriae bacterium]|nr:glutathione peroxidase [Ignavibacteriota bacterium]
MIKTKFKISFLLVILVLTVGCSKTKTGNSENLSNNLNSKKDITVNKNIYDISVINMDGDTVKLSEYKGKVLMIVNVASKCGYTSQYEGLENIYQKYNEKGFEILAFPCNDFGGQEPGTNEEIRTFCETKFNVTFPLFDKIEVLGDNKSPLYERLINNSEPAGDIGWNFEKFIISKDGDIIARYKSKVTPESDEITGVIETELSK